MVCWKRYKSQIPDTDIPTIGRLLKLIENPSLVISSWDFLFVTKFPIVGI
jgi:hypothetical protein